jgi:hypothetical protein
MRVALLIVTLPQLAFAQGVRLGATPEAGAASPAIDNGCMPRPNLAANPEALNINGYWTANAAVAPDGTTTADRLATATVAERYVVNLTPGGGAVLNRTFTLSAYCKAVSGTPTMYMGVTDGASWNEGHACQSACVLNATTYTRCAVTCTYTASGASTTVGMVPFSPVGHLGNGNVAALNVDCWGLKPEEGPRPTRYVAASGWRGRCR